MIESEKQAFARLMVGLGEYYGKDQSKQVLAIYWKALERYDLAAVDEACSTHIANADTGQWFPKIADIVRLIDGGSNDRALLAWTKVDQAVRSVGSMQTVCFDDALINAVISDMGGWPSFGTKNNDEWPFVAKEFQQRYRGLTARTGQLTYPPSLPGIADSHNIMQGYGAATPVLIGDAVKAKVVYEGGAAVRRIGISTFTKPAASVPQLVERAA